MTARLMPKPAPSDFVIAILIGITQTIGYGSLYYSFGVLAPFMAEDTGLSLTFVYGLFSIALLASGFIAPRAGRLLDGTDPARVMTFGSCLGAMLLAAWALAPGKIAFGVFLILSQMSSVLVLYEAAFVLAARLSPMNARRTITGITLIAGFASTIFWPLTSWLTIVFDWRTILLLFAGLNLLVCAPLHLFLTRRVARSMAGKTEVGQQLAQGTIASDRDRRIAFRLLLIAFAANAFVMSAVHLHLIGLLGALGLGASAALIGALIGPAQVAGRIAEFTAGPRISVMSVALFATGALPAGLGFLVGGSGYLPAAIVFALVFGAGQGLSYIVRGVLPLTLFGANGYGARTGRINSVRLFVSAGAPFLAAAIFERFGAQAVLGVIAAAGIIGFVAIVAIVPILRRAGQPGAPT
ncbi:MFS transporter [Mesorhizobium sp. YIM 152430]|uniref:MFS transporter n=1 Tax=Mesorhizobium sp. YIM 152430 TaxID=3031761 RepID=UPI0023DC2DD3|nr:MFS transporter [Mesorhizobium sp. YIM 152430]MDF1599206.1 MFS transporter [Mesorhizobium sp. YIM 152430]